MDSSSRGTDGLLRWLVETDRHELNAIDVSGDSLPATLEPPLRDAMASARRDGSHCPARLTLAGSATREVLVVPVPGSDRVAIALEPSSAQRPPDTALESLVNQIAHDVRNYAFTVGLQAEMGARRASEIPEVKGHFEAALRQVDGLKRYLEQLLLFGRAVHPAAVPVDAVAFVHDQVERLRFTRAGESSVLTVAVHAEPSSVVAHWDPDLLGHALQAVLDNAVRSAEPPPSVTVTVRQTAGRVRIEVSDRGKGIPREILARLSIPMSVRRPGGAGLGLAIARKMVEAHHGRLAVESGNAGTTVCFDLPVEAFPG